ncbi:MAG: alpha/beta fold hydrolase, partial [Polyangiaceae bacterium]
LVEAMHRTIASGPAILGKPLEGPARIVTGLVYGGIKGVTGLVGTGIDAALEQLAPVLGESVPGPERAAVLAALNGVLGDYLSETKNPLAIEMRLCHKESEHTRKVLVLLHGSSMNEQQWTRLGHDHGAALARDLGYTPVYLRYNSGLHISTNGRAFSELLETLLRDWPEPVDELVLVGHSMGGLVARSACHAGEKSAWRKKLTTLVCLGTPHHGAPLERGGSWVDLLLGISNYSAPFKVLGQIRSAGVTDLRFGNVLDEHWDGRDRFLHGEDPRSELTLPKGVRCFAIAGTKSPAKGPKLRGDGMVPVDSALGRHKKPELTLAFDGSWIAYGTGHLELLSRPEVYETIRSWLT